MATSSIFDYIKSILEDTRVKQMFFCSTELEGYYNQLIATIDSVTDYQYRRVDFDSELDTLTRFSRNPSGDLLLDFQPFVTITGNYVDGKTNQPMAIARRPSNGDFWVISRYTRPAVFDSNWNFIQFVGRWGTGNTETIYYPTYGTFYVDGLVREWLIIGSYDYHYYKFFLLEGNDLQHKFTLGDFGHAGTNGTRLDRPRQVAFDTVNKKMYVVNTYGRPSSLTPPAVRDGYISRYDISGLDNDPPSAPVFEEHVLWGSNGSCLPDMDLVCNPLGVEVNGDNLIVTFGGNIAVYEITDTTPYQYRYLFQPANPPYHHNPAPRYIHKYIDPDTSEIRFAIPDATLGTIALFDESGRALGWVGSKQWESYPGNPNSPLRFYEPWHIFLYKNEGELYVVVSDYGNNRVQVGSFTDLSTPAEIITKPIEFPREVEIKDIIVETNIPTDFMQIWYRYGDNDTWFLLEKNINMLVTNKIQIRIEVGPFINTYKLPESNSVIESIGIIYKME